MYQPAEERTGGFALKAPVHAYLELTQACNLRCGHCFNSTRFSGERIKEAPIEQIVEKIIEWEVFDVTLSGGEALLRKPQLYSALEKLSSGNIPASLNTNLTLISQDDVKKLRDYGLMGILTSLHSDKPQEHDEISGKKYSFHRTIKGIEEAVNGGIPVAINLVGSKRTKDNIYDVSRLAKSLGVSQFTVSPIVTNPTKTEDHLSESLNPKELMALLWDLYRVKTELGIETGLQRLILPCFFWEHTELRYLANKSCSANSFLVNIRPDGEVTGCPTLNKPYGNLLYEQLDRIWQNVAQAFNENPVFLGCKECDMKVQCNGGCKAENIALGLKHGKRHPLMKNPINFTKNRDIKLEIGTRVVPNYKHAQFRDERTGFYSLMTDSGRYYVLTRQGFEVIKAISQAPLLVIDENVIKMSDALQTIEDMVKTDILKVQEA